MMNELEVLKFWEENKTFEKSVAQRSEEKRYTFYDGPPFATGLPHYGHIVASTIKDIVPRYWAMKGYRVERRWGWDCHGLPIENIVEEELKLKSRKEIMKLGVAKFNAACRERVLHYAAEWKKTIHRLGRWVDMERAYTTMDRSYMESVWWVFQRLWEKGLVYEGRKAMHICPRCETVLSNFEVTQGYKDITDLSAIVRFELRPKNGQALAPWSGKKKLYALAWTTTPWTLPGNVALAVNPTATYIIVEDDNDHNYYLVEKSLSEKLFTGEHAGCDVGDEFHGAQLVGIPYAPLFPDLGHSYANDNGWKILAADFVTTAEGTGIVHIAPAFGEDDMRLGQENGLPFIQHVAMNGLFSEEVTGFSEIAAKPKDDHQSGDVAIIKHLAKQGALFAKEKYIHSYPHCWRCDTPLLNYAASSWFVKVTALKKKLVANNQTIVWVPEYMKDGRFGKWLEGARDWAVSRSRFWGTPLPIWRAESGETLCVGSAQELEELSGQTVADLHKDAVDTIVIQKDGKEYRRIPEVLDCWFESGAMPYGQLHYPFENKEQFEKNFPAEFIGEGQDQTRGWFYTLHVLSTALFGKAAFRNVIVNGIVLSEDGKKMSKRLKNYPDPELVIGKYGADALRMYLALSPVMEAENLNFSEKGVDEVYKKMNLLLGNVYNFWELYHDASSAPAPADPPSSPHPMDRWLVATTEALIQNLTNEMDQYFLSRSARLLVEYVQELSTWYVRRSRARFKGDDAQEKERAIQTLGWALRMTAIAVAPFMPMLSEAIYQGIGGKTGASVHLEDWPQVRGQRSEVRGQSDILSQMAEVRAIVSVAHQLRADSGIKIRQPLQTLTINKQLPEALLEIVRDEVNVKEVVTDENAKALAILETTLSEPLINEGKARELIRLINAQRKKQGFTIHQSALVLVSSNDHTWEEVVKSFHDEIRRATVALDVQFVAGPEELMITITRA